LGEPEVTKLKKPTEALFNRFTAELKKKLIKGQEEYGDRTYERDVISLLREVQGEAIDYSGWSMFLWARCEELINELKPKGGKA
jgi:hypothetical protein